VCRGLSLLACKHRETGLSPSAAGRSELKVVAAIRKLLGFQEECRLGRSRSRKGREALHRRHIPQLLRHLLDACRLFLHGLHLLCLLLLHLFHLLCLLFLHCLHLLYVSLFQLLHLCELLEQTGHLLHAARGNILLDLLLPRLQQAGGYRRLPRGVLRPVKTGASLACKPTLD